MRTYYLSFLRMIYNKENEKVNGYALFMIYAIKNNCVNWYIENILINNN